MLEYNALILLPPRNNSTIQDVKDLLTKSFQRLKEDVKIEGTNGLLLIGDGWKCGIELNGRNHVVKESAELAEEFAVGHSNQQEIASCNRRFEVDFEDDDDAVGFNDYINILQELESLDGAKVWDSAVQEFEQK